MKAYDPIPLPTAEEKEHSISMILSENIPAKQSLFTLIKARDTLSLSVLFFGVEDAVFLAVLLFFLCLIPATTIAATQGAIAPIVFLVSPLLYAILQLLTTWKEAMSGTLDWKRTCIVSHQTINALRMLFFGGSSILLCVPQNLLLWLVTGKKLSLLWMLSLSFASLFLYAAMTLLLQRRCRLLAGVITFLLWIGVGIVLLSWKDATYFLMKIPALVFFGLAAIAQVVALFELKASISRPIEGGLNYANR